MMPPSVFLDRDSPPKDTDLQEALGRAGALWDRLKERAAANYPPVSEKWGYSGKSYGWSLQLKQKSRTILYMIPCRKHFVASFAMGEKACAAARKSGLPPGLIDLIEKAPRFPEGRAVRLEVRASKDIDSVESLAAIKMSS